MAQYTEILNFSDVTITQQHNLDAQESSDNDVNSRTREERKRKPARPCPLRENTATIEMAHKHSA